jgi:hypothetical protein
MKPIILLLLLSLSHLLAESEQAQSGFRFGERPKNSVFDPAGILTVKEQTELAEPLAMVRAREGIDVMVVILPKIGDAPPDHVAKGFAEKWAATDVNAVVLHVPGREGTPWIFPGNVMGSMVKPETLRESVVGAEKRAAAEPTDFGKVRAASTEASDALRYWMGAARIRSEEIISEQLEARLAYENRRRLLKLAAILGAAAVIPLVLGIVFIALRIRNSRPRHFPSTRMIPRLGAPYSGGNNAVSKYV